MYSVYSLYDVLNICWVDERNLTENACHLVVRCLSYELLAVDGSFGHTHDCLLKILVNGAANIWKSTSLRI